jgi:hypothetical protein
VHWNYLSSFLSASFTGAYYAYPRSEEPDGLYPHKETKPLDGLTEDSTTTDEYLVSYALACVLKYQQHTRI